jgi:hypothetical protein
MHSFISAATFASNHAIVAERTCQPSDSRKTVGAIATRCVPLGHLWLEQDAQTICRESASNQDVDVLVVHLTTAEIHEW